MTDSRLVPINFKKWIDENRHLLKPPVGNRQIWENRDFMVTVVGGPNSRTDYHINEGEEFFYQVEGNITLRLRDQGKPLDVEIREGDIFLLPPNVPHSPQRGPGTVGLVLERKRGLDELDHFEWYCEKCGEKLHRETVHLKDIVKDLPVAFTRFFDNEANSTCKKCGVRMKRKS